MSRRGDATRRLVVEVASRLFRARGASLSMEAVARAAKLSRQALYLHFPSRTALLLAVMDHLGREAGGETLFGDAAKAGSASAVFEQTLAAAVEYHARIADLVQALDVARHADPVAREAWDDRNQLRWKGILRQVRQLERAKKLRPGWTPRQVTDAVWVLTSPRLQLDLARGRGWKKRDLERLLLTLSRCFVR